MSIESSVSLVFSMAILAALPSISVITVSVRSAAFGLSHGVATALGILFTDLLFVAIALWGLSLLAGVLGDFFIYIKYLGGCYLIATGLLLLSRHTRINPEISTVKASLASSFLAGLLITLGDQKALILYFGFFHAIVKVDPLTIIDSAIILAITVFSVGGTKLLYAVFAARLGQFEQSGKIYRIINILAAVILCGVGGYLLLFS